MQSSSNIPLLQSHSRNNSDKNNNYNTKQPLRLSISEAVKVLVPSTTSSRQQLLEKEQIRFSQLLLEHGEKHLQDWAVMAYSSPAKDLLDVHHRSRGNPRTVRYGLAGESPRKKLSKTQWAQDPTAQKVANKTPPRFHTSGNSKLHSNRSQHDSQGDAETYPSTQLARIEGRLHLCSRSIIFDPRDYSKPIVRCPFRKMEGAPREYPPVDHTVPQKDRFESMCIEFRSNRGHMVMKENAAPAPFTTVPIAVDFRFTFLHSSPAPFCELCQQLFALWKNHSNSASLLSYELAELEDLLRPMYVRPFDTQQLVDVRERILTATPTSVRAYLLTPLQRKPGCVVVTTERVYFQPASGAIAPTDTKAMHWSVRNIVATACRYNGLRDCALELYFRDDTTTIVRTRSRNKTLPSVLLAFNKKRDRETVLRCLPLSAWSFTDRDFVVQAVQAWQSHQISNYEYLLALNAAAGRSFHDLSRYPVFPWVLKDYESAQLDWNNPDKIYRDLSKSVGALNPERLQYFKTRFEGMQDMDDSFLYGTHYSNPGYVLYFLVRSMPEHMLCLQNGKFDAPDRMFYDMNHCFNCVLTNHADVKELIPEFYSTNDFDFLINARGLRLGATQRGERVDDVILPPWAKSPRDFLVQNRKALESEHCTKMLPQWIDLIFGCKSRGEAAKKADNLFHSCCYLGDNDLAGINLMHQRFQAELQATEFGLVPDQLFSKDHPARLQSTESPEDVVLDEDLVSPEFSAARCLAGNRNLKGKGETWELLDSPSATNSSHGEHLLTNPSSSSSNVLRKDSNPNSDPQAISPKIIRAATATETSLSMAASANTPFGGPTHRPADTTRRRNLPLSGTGALVGDLAGRCAFSSLGSAENSSQQIQNAASFDSANSVSPRHHHPAGSISFSTEWTLEVIERLQIHGDAVSGCALVLEGEGRTQLLTTTSLDGGLMTHTVSLSPQVTEDPSRRGFTGTLSRFSYISTSREPPSPQSKLTEYRRHSARDPLACLVLTSDGAGGQVAFAGGHDDVVLAYGINSACAVASVYSHRDAVTGLELIPRSSSSGGQSALWPDKATHIMVSGSWDATVKVWSVAVDRGETVSVIREPLAELYDADSSIVCVSAVSVHHLEPGGGIVLAAGCADGSFCVWNLHGDGVKTVIHNEPAKRGSGPCSVVKWNTEEGHINLFVGFSTGKVASLTLEGGILQKKSALSFGVSVNCMVYSEGTLLVGCADGGLRLIQVRNGTQFESKPSLWPSVNNKSSPGLSSINITHTTASCGKAKCICCSGGEDGSVALFELKRAVPSSVSS